MRAITHRKHRYETAVPVNITLPPLLYEKMATLIKDRGFKGPADYIQARIRLDSGLSLVPQPENEQIAA